MKPKTAVRCPRMAALLPIIIAVSMSPATRAFRALLPWYMATNPTGKADRQMIVTNMVYQKLSIGETLRTEVNATLDAADFKKLMK